MKKNLLYVLVLIVVMAFFLGAAGFTPSTVKAWVTTTTQTTGHTPVTICHKPGTPAEQTLVVDDDAVPGHLGHGDYLGECRHDTTTTETTTETTTGTTTTTPTTTTTTTTPQPPCPNGEPPIHGKDGNPGNDACNPCLPPVNVEKCPPSTTTMVTTETVPPTTTTETVPPTTVTTTTESTTTQTTETQTTETVPPPPAPPKHHKPKHHKPKHPSMPPVCSPNGVETAPCAVPGQG